MSSIENPHAKRLYDSLLNYTDEKSSESIADIIHLTKTPTNKTKIKWAELICRELESCFDDSTIKAIRMNCSCGPSQGRMDKVKQIYDQAADLNDFTGLYNKANLGSTIWIDEGIYFSYPTCYCSMVNKIDTHMSKSWCYCTLGYTKKMFEYVLGYEVEVELLESVKSGNEKCVMKIIRK